MYKLCAKFANMTMTKWLPCLKNFLFCSEIFENIMKSVF